MSRAPHLDIVEVVTREHGEKFVEEWWYGSMSSGVILKAFTETAVVEWPNRRTAQMRFHDLQYEVTKRILDAVRQTASEAFVRIAGEVLARERLR